MTDDQHGDRHSDQPGAGTPPSGGRWDPLPQGDYDDGATAFVKLPEGGVDALLASADSPLAAPGHGYVPPQITVAPATTAGTDPAATGSWAMPSAPVDGTQWQVPDAGQGSAAHQGYAEYQQQDPYGGSVPYDANAPYATNAPYDTNAGQADGFTYRPGATGQWDFSEAGAGAGADAASGQDVTGHDVTGQDVTGQWSIPVADGDLPDESGEFTQSSLAEQWGGTAPATLPGGAPAPWATQQAGQPWGDRTAQAGQAAQERPVGQERPADDRSVSEAPDPAAGAYAEAPAEAPAESAAEPVVETDPEAPAADGAVTDEPQGAEEAPDGHSEPSADAVENEDAESGPRAAEEPVTGPTPVAATGERTREPRQDGDPDSDRDRDGDPELRTETDPDPAAASAAGPAASQEHAPSGPHEEHPLASYVLRVNGADRPVTDAWIGESLLYVLRERLGLAGAKDGCSQGECGACNVQVDGRLVASCLVPAVTSAGSEVRTVEGLAADGRPSDVQRALARRGAVQCGFCVPGMAMTVHNLLEGNPAPTELEARQALCGNLCRCSGYRGVLDAVQEVVAEREAHAAADANATDADEPRIPHQAGPGAGGVNPSAFESHGPPGAPPGNPDTSGPHPRGPHDQPYDDESYGDESYDDQPYDDQSYDDRPHGQGAHGHGPHGQDGGHA
ncbi:2Fe-2S iron-sulfur cluster-binding protein [Streptomyces sp. DH41]|uniref:2Fe-2S iron-sulfur cluster-binding protein n=1 Tax=Streptomyces sp. DH41 TaxID=3040125 RepID=UPI002442A377|nr:2Fe-2S iron-sulfur cluster-binding protein [Streptomyces sp. DH41]MDG9721729.1 2Fe-2S iron-sulfur cluster-binding protein [Streptomyces sp. DH41]